MLQNTCGNKQGQMMTPVSVVSMENEWDMTLGPVYLLLVNLNSLM